MVFCRMYVCALSVYNVQGTRRPEEDIRSLENGVTNNWVHVCWESNLHSLLELPVLLITQPLSRPSRTLTRKWGSSFSPSWYVRSRDWIWVLRLASNHLEPLSYLIVPGSLVLSQFACPAHFTISLNSVFFFHESFLGLPSGLFG